MEQTGNWDCGLACIQMVLSEELAIELGQNLNTICSEVFQNKRYLILKKGRITYLIYC